VPQQVRQAMAGQRIVRLVKGAPGGPMFEVIENPDAVARLTGQRGKFDLAAEFGIDPELVESFDITTRLAIAAGLLALRDANIPLVMQHKTATTGARLPVGYRLPRQLADETGIIFASAFPGYDQLIGQMEKRKQHDVLQARLEELERLEQEVGPMHAIRRRLEELRSRQNGGYQLDRKFIFRVLSFGHAQLAEIVGARGPNV